MFLKRGDPLGIGARKYKANVAGKKKYKNVMLEKTNLSPRLTLRSALLGYYT
jgi:hypothetical protein